MPGYSHRDQNDLVCSEPPTEAPVCALPDQSRQGNAAMAEKVRRSKSSGSNDLYKGGRSVLDALGVADAYQIAKNSKGVVPGKGLNLGPADKFLGPLGTVLSLYDAGKGLSQIRESQTNPERADSDLKMVDGIHDTVRGSAGLAWNLPGPAGSVAKAFGAGFAVGDLLAPVVFGSEEEDNKAKTVEGDHFTDYKPSTGNKWVDKGLDLLGR